jgi:hypothetical protein
MASGALADGGGGLGLPFVQGIRLSFFVVSAVREAHEPETVPLVEATSAHVLLEDPQPQASGTTLLRNR